MIYYFLTFILQHPSTLHFLRGRRTPTPVNEKTEKGKRLGLCKVQSDFCFCIRGKQNSHIFSQIHIFCGFNCRICGITGKSSQSSTFCAATPSAALMEQSCSASAPTSQVIRTFHKKLHFWKV